MTHWRVTSAFQEFGKEECLMEECLSSSVWPTTVEAQATVKALLLLSMVNRTYIKRLLFLQFFTACMKLKFNPNLISAEDIKYY